MNVIAEQQDIMIRLRCWLEQQQDIKYQGFSNKLLPGTERVLGVRLPLLRQKVKEMLAESNDILRAELLPEPYFEEIMIKGMAIGHAKLSFAEKVDYLTGFIPLIDNWSVCDSVCVSLKFKKSEKAQVWEYLQLYLSSEREFFVRFGLVMLLDHFIDAEYIDQVLQKVDNASLNGYYAEMAAAWLVSICFVKFPERTWGYLNDNRLSDDVCCKSLQKIVESYRVSEENKLKIRELRQKIRKNSKKG